MSGDVGKQVEDHEAVFRAMDNKVILVVGLVIYNPAKDTTLAR